MKIITTRKTISAIRTYLFGIRIWKRTEGYSYWNLVPNVSQFDGGREQWCAKHDNFDDYIKDLDLHEYAKKLAVLSAGIRTTENAAIPGFCEVCDRVTKIKVCNPFGDREDMWCEECLMNPRMRAMHEFVKMHAPDPGKVYADEFVTTTFKNLKKFYGEENITGAEFLGEDKTSGKIYDGIMHQNAENLSFADDSFGLIVSQHVFEHVPDYKKALKEYFRVLKKGGRLAISIPFFPENKFTILRAELKNGKVRHILPPEIHGNPADPAGGALVFHNHGWDFLDAMRKAGFKDVNVHFYSNALKGHFGLQNIILGAK
ncbi:MAG: methyltransferase domain-containing protein [Alphaproteobacteria bacterium]|nr:methyltransferase domain-containing protein [Alphaproteobacteria bacterium]